MCEVYEITKAAYRDLCDYERMFNQDYYLCPDDDDPDLLGEYVLVDMGSKFGYIYPCMIVVFDSDNLTDMRLAKKVREKAQLEKTTTKYITVNQRSDYEIWHIV